MRQSMSHFALVLRVAHSSHSSWLSRGEILDHGGVESVSCPWILRSSGDKRPHCHHELPSRLQNHAAPGFAKCPDWRAHRNTSGPQCHNIVAPRNTFSKQFRVAAQKKSVTLGHAVHILRQWRLLRTWTRLSAGTSISELKPIRHCTDSCRSPFFVAETLIAWPDSAFSWQSLLCFRLRQHSGSYHFTITTFVFIETRLLILCATALWASGTFFFSVRSSELQLPSHCEIELLNLVCHRAHSHRQARGCGRCRTSLIQVSKRILAYSGFLGQAFQDT